MKKIFLALFMMVVFYSSVFADEYGIAAKLGMSDNNYPSSYGNVQTSPLVFGIECFYEWSLTNNKLQQEEIINKIGIKLGLDLYGKNKLQIEFRDIHGIPTDPERWVIKERSKSLPVTVYYKWDKGEKYLSYFVGGGFTFISSNLSANYLESNIKEYKWFPHVVVGGEHRFTKDFALGIDFKYNFCAKLKKGDLILSDHSGLQGSLLAKFYF